MSDNKSTNRVFNFQGIDVAICERLNFGDVDFVESMR